MEVLKGKKVLVTGGAGFIGSNLVAELLDLGAFVRVFDNLETGKLQNLDPFLDHPCFEFTEGDIRSEDQCRKAVSGVDVISHQAALGSVPRSIAFPHNTHDVNATGFLNMLHAAKEAGVKRFVYASSSSVYGDSQTSPKAEGAEGNPLSPYAVTKSLNEKYAKVYHQLHAMESIGLRYFNVFGTGQDPNGVYAAAIPKFIDKMIKGEANILGLTSSNKEAFGEVFNVACGSSYSLNRILLEIEENLKKNGLFDARTTILYGPERSGDVRDSLANISKINKLLGYSGKFSFYEGISEYISGMNK